MQFDTEYKILSYEKFKVGSFQNYNARNYRKYAKKNDYLELVNDNHTIQVLWRLLDKCYIYPQAEIYKYKAINNLGETVFYFRNVNNNINEEEQKEKDFIKILNKITNHK